MKKLLHAFCLLVSIQPVFAQESYLRHYSTADGLPGSETYSVFQDHKGYIWIASDMGISRFDGYNFKVFTTADGLTDNTIFRFFEDHKGRLWFYTFSGKLCYYFNDSIYGKDFPINIKVREFLGSGSPTTLSVDEHDTIFLATSKGLLKIIPETDNGKICWNSLQVLNSDFCYLFEGGYFSVEGLPGNRLQFTKYENGQNKATYNLPISFSDFKGSYICPDKKSLLYSETKIAVLDTLGGLEFIKGAGYGISLYRENDSIMWVGLKQGGIDILNINDLSIKAKDFLTTMSVTGILKDREGGFWFSTLESGIFYLPSIKFHYFTKIEGPITLPQSSIHVIGKDRVWISTIKKIFEARGTEIGQVPAALADYRSQQGGKFWDIHSHSNGEIWISTSTDIMVFDSFCKKIINRLTLDAACAESDSRLIIEDHLKNAWSLTHACLTEFEHGSKKLLKTVLLPSRAESACEDNDGNILIGAIDGLYRLKHDSLTYLGTDKAIFRNRFVDVKKFDGKIAGATRGAGLIIISGDSVYQITTANGLRSNMCRSIYIDDQNTIWVSGSGGLNSVRFHEHPVKVDIDIYTVSDGLLSNDNVQVIRCGKLIWLLSNEGITAFDPDDAVRNDIPPPVYITKVGLNNVFRSPDQVRSVNYAANFIEIYFAGLTYKSAGKQLYKFRLEGYDTTWNYTRNNFVQFTKLAPGNYKFKVSCINNSGVESLFPAIFAFTVNAPFYRKWWFWIFFSLLTAAIAIIILVLVLRQIRKREAIKTEINRKIANLELQALRAQMNPHFIFNCINAIQDFILSNDPVSAKHYLSNFSKLIRKTLDYSRKPNILLEDEIALLHLYLDLEKMRFSDKFDYHIEVQKDLIDQNIEIPSMILQPFIENAIRHGGIGNLEHQGEVRIIFSMRQNTLVCIIEDNGIGLNESRKMKEEHHPEQPHALGILKERIKTINEMNNSEIWYTITDKSDVTPGIKGTEVIIQIPIENEAI
jgi:hypothetical protein